MGRVVNATPLGKTWYPFYRWLGGPQGWSGQVRKMLPPLGFDFRTVKTVASPSNDCAITAQYVVHEFKTNKIRSCDLIRGVYHRPCSYTGLFISP